jgi:hypothetical protein
MAVVIKGIALRDLEALLMVPVKNRYVASIAIPV